MFGMAFYNNLLPQKKLEFQLMPMYSAAQKDLAGYGRVMYNLFSDDYVFQKIQVGVTATRYDYSNDPFNMNFNKIAPELFIEFKKKYARSPITQTLRYRYISIQQDDFIYEQVVNAAKDTSYAPARTSNAYNYNDITYKFKRYDAINPFDISLNYQQGKDFMKTSLTANYSCNYKNKNKSFDVRLFAGTFLGDNNSTNNVQFRLAGQTGYQDYLYDNIYFGRSEVKGVLSQQFTETDGGFKFLAYSGQTSKWIVAMNLKSSLGNAKIPLNLYADIGTTANDGNTNNSIFYDAGFCISLPKKIFEIYFPILLCPDFKSQVKANGWKYQETIRFTLNLKLINPFDLINNFKL